jgi:hypothetical protein
MEFGMFKGHYYRFLTSSIFKKSVGGRLIFLYDGSMIALIHVIQTRWFLCEFPIGSYVKLSSAVQPSWSEGRTTRHKFGRGPSNDYFIKVWFQLSNWFQTRRFS